MQDRKNRGVAKIFGFRMHKTHQNRNKHVRTVIKVTPRRLQNVRRNIIKRSRKVGNLKFSRKTHLSRIVPVINYTHYTHHPFVSLAGMINDM